MKQIERIHALDNLRGIIMWLGIVLHVAVQHLTGPSPLPWHDSQTTPWADLITVFIHVFRMPVFFILAGFFAAMLANKHGMQGMLANRAKRIALPFLVFWPILFVSMMVLGLMFVHLMKTGTIGIDMSLVPKPKEQRLPSGDHPLINTMHLWFMYYLMWFCLSAWLLGKIAPSVPSRVTLVLTKIAKLFVTRWWGFILLSLPLAYIGSFYPHGMVAPNGFFIPNQYEFLHNGLFFAFGWAFFRYKDALIPRFQKKLWWYLLIGCIFFIGALVCFEMDKKQVLPKHQSQLLIAFVYNLATWLWSFFLIGLFLRFVNSHSKILRYLSDSSYWVYLVHMCGTIGFGVLLYDTELGAGAKILLNILLTSLACIISYHLLVRYSFISKFLNGYKHQRERNQGDKQVVSAS